MVAVEVVVEVEEVTATIAMAVVSQVVSFCPLISIIKEDKYVLVASTKDLVGQMSTTVQEEESQ